jgi:hypothetical protein
MFRKLALGFVAVAAIAAFVPSIASAKGGKGGGGFHGHHGHWGGHGRFYRGSAFLVGDNCLQYRVVETRRGLRTRLVNVCAY